MTYYNRMRVPTQRVPSAPLECLVHHQEALCLMDSPRSLFVCTHGHLRSALHQQSIFFSFKFTISKRKIRVSNHICPIWFTYFWVVYVNWKKWFECGFIPEMLVIVTHCITYLYLWLNYTNKSYSYSHINFGFHSGIPPSAVLPYTHNISE